MFKIQKHYKVIAVFLFVLTLSVLSGGKAHAASITVNTDTNPSPCTIDEAIVNINNHARTNTNCVETGTYGTDDTITIPEGTVLLTANLPTLTSPGTIVGAGIGVSTISGTGAYRGIVSNSVVSVSNLTITAFSTYAILTTETDAMVEKVEIDGTNAVFPTGLNSNGWGVAIVNSGPNPIQVTINNLYIHDMSGNGTSNIFPVLATTGRDSPGNTGDANVSITNTTIENIEGAGNVFAVNVAAGMASYGFGTGILQAEISNVTITNIHSSAGPAAGIVVAAITPENRTTTASVSNGTITNISGLPNSLFGGASASGLIAVTAGFIDGLTNTINLTSRNMLISDTSLSCSTFDASSVLGSNSTGVFNVSSQGGNLSNDTSCTPYFTQPSDQNNLTTLNSTLGSLSNNGGFVPTIPLLQGSPAIDSGVTVAGLTTDARLAARPQGSAYDSGAYESSFSKATKTSATLASTGQNTTLYILASLITLTLATGSIALNQRSNN